jgi:hypothetical protein
MWPDRCGYSVDGVDLGEWLVRNGLALDWLRYSKGRQPGLGATPSAPVASWKGSYIERQLYRACIRASGKPSHCSDDASAHP